VTEAKRSIPSRILLVIRAFSKFNEGDMDERSWTQIIFRFRNLLAHAKLRRCKNQQTLGLSHVGVPR
jgi:hypothetical protein